MASNLSCSGSQASSPTPLNEMVACGKSSVAQYFSNYTVRTNHIVKRRFCVSTLDSSQRCRGCWSGDQIEGRGNSSQNDFMPPPIVLSSTGSLPQNSLDV